jgi:hypothetical protein
LRWIPAVGLVAAREPCYCYPEESTFTPDLTAATESSAKRVLSTPRAASMFCPIGSEGTSATISLSVSVGRLLSRLRRRYILSAATPLLRHGGKNLGVVRSKDVYILAVV